MLTVDGMQQSVCRCNNQFSLCQWPAARVYCTRVAASALEKKKKKNKRRKRKMKELAHTRRWTVIASRPRQLARVTRETPLDSRPNAKACIVQLAVAFHAKKIQRTWLFRVRVGISRRRQIWYIGSSSEYLMTDTVRRNASPNERDCVSF